MAARNHVSERRRRIATDKANVFAFCSGAQPFVPKQKKREVVGGPHRWLRYRQSVDTERGCEIEKDNQILASDVAASNIHAVTSPANWIACAKDKGLALCGQRLGAVGASRRSKGQGFGWRSE